MRNIDEITFRLRQELTNLWLLAAPPEARCDIPAPVPKLPPPSAVIAAIADTAVARQILDVADKVLAHRFPILGIEISTGAEIDWNRDYVHGVSNPVRYFRRLPYLDFSQAGDHKIIWELNRHQHLVVLAQAWLLTQDRKYLDELTAQLRHWWSRNPYQCGMNWASALEVAFRALSWIWVYHLAGADFEAAFRTQFATELCRHARHLEANLSVYFSPNTHLLGEAVALHAIGTLFPALPGAAAWRRTGADVISAQMDSQVRADGSHFEQSSYYHVYAVDFFVFHALLENVTAGYKEKLVRMVEYLHALMQPAGRLPILGDDDGGRLFHPYGERDRFGRATLATCAVLLNRPAWLFDAADLYEQAVWWLGAGVLTGSTAARRQAQSRFFPDAGVAVMAHHDIHIVADAGPFGTGSGGHSHSDTLSLVVRRGEQDILIDPGTYTYISDPKWRNRFRGTAAHNTVRVNGRDQAVPAGPFRWTEKPAVQVHSWTTADNLDKLDASCRYAGVEHRRVIVFKKPDLVIVFDDIRSAGSLTAEQRWHAVELVAAAETTCFHAGCGVYLAIDSPETGVVTTEGDYGWRSPALGRKEAAPVLTVTKTGTGCVVFATALSFSGPVDVTLMPVEGSWRVTASLADQESARVSVDFEPTGERKC